MIAGVLCVCLSFVSSNRVICMLLVCMNRPAVLVFVLLLYERSVEGLFGEGGGGGWAGVGV